MDIALILFGGHSAARPRQKVHEKFSGMMRLPGVSEFDLLVLDLLTLNPYKREDFYK
ncbi:MULTISPECIES: hypothetical protein [unclassified Polaromonas]|uniref:hypothetical protein n=1 Tax=unclassified Polaromonas TaxID=2638319 RepID=UPI00129E0318|nr:MULTISPECIES: hypothetical protein [unclassified Polaromonas]